MVRVGGGSITLMLNQYDWILLWTLRERGGERAEKNQTCLLLLQLFEISRLISGHVTSVTKTMMMMNDDVTRTMSHDDEIGLRHELQFTIAIVAGYTYWAWSVELSRQLMKSLLEIHRSWRNNVWFALLAAGIKSAFLVLTVECAPETQPSQLLPSLFEFG